MHVFTKFNCKDCDKFYIGQTGKSLETRLKQHKYSVKTAQDSSALFVHLRDNNHRIDWSSSSSIAPCKSYMNRNIIESALIKKTENSNINQSSGMYKLDSFMTDNIFRMFRLL